VAALGYYELRVNGVKVGDHVLDPAWTTYPKRVLHSTYDVTEHLRQGANAVGAMLGGGWATLGSQAYYKAPALLVELRIELDGGKRVTVVSDTSWKTKHGPIISDSIYDGEIYDARREISGWDKPGLADADWKAATISEGTQGDISSQMMPPIRVVDTLLPRAMTNPRPGLYVYDFGQNVSGWAQLRVQGPAGTRVRLRFAELLYPDGTINRENIRAAKARDIYILKGEGRETYEPRFTYHGFRYVEVTGYPGTPTLDSLRGRVVHTAVASAGDFAASNPVLNQIHSMVRRTQLNNLHSVPTDCPQREERQGWMGDAHLSSEAAALNFDMAAFYTNFLRDIRDVQDADGTITDTVPHKYGSRPADPAWGAAFPILAWRLYEEYGDRRALEENYDGLKKYVDFLHRQAPDNILRLSYYGDWIATEETPGPFLSALYYDYSVQILAKVAQVLGKTADAQAYADLERQIKEAINREFLHRGDLKTYDGDTYYANGTQTANALALFLDLPPKEHRPKLVIRLYNDIVYWHNTHLTTGIHGTRYLLPVLTALGHADQAYDLVTQTDYPSWGYMLAHGATTIWELWQYKVGPSMNSHDHPALGSVGAWFFRALGGLNPDPSGPGYRHIFIQPQIVRDLSSASATLQTIRGALSCSWTHKPEEITVEVTVPVNSDARVVIPKEPQMNNPVIREGDRIVWENGRFVPGVPGVLAGTAGLHTGLLVAASNVYTFEVGSGHYRFTLTEPPE
jgi:alpha-L-rhamnosidase